MSMASQYLINMTVERTLPFHEQRRSYETMQQWLKEFVEQGILSRYMSLFVMVKRRIRI